MEIGQDRNNIMCCRDFNEFNTLWRVRGFKRGQTNREEVFLDLLIILHHHVTGRCTKKEPERLTMIKSCAK